MLEKEIHFEGDESWKLTKLPSIKEFFYGWFDGKKGKLLEGGSGIGNYVITFAKLGFDVTGIEYSKERVKIAKENCKKYKVKARVVQGDVRRTPFKNKEFDLIFSHGVVEHFPDTQKALNEFGRIIKNDGYAMISVPNRITVFVINKLAQMIIGKILNKTIWKCGYEQSFTRNKFKMMLNEAGFEIIDYRIGEINPGTKFPLYGKILQIIDKPLFLLGIGGHFNCYFCRKKPEGR